MEKITAEVAYEISVLKWKELARGKDFEIVRLKNRKLLKNIPLKALLGACGFCEYYRKVEYDFHCGKCPLVINKRTCMDMGSLYSRWSIAEETYGHNSPDAKALAKEILNKIIESKEIHFQNGK
jgi:hypothetical protein